MGTGDFTHPNGLKRLKINLNRPNRAFQIKRNLKKNFKNTFAENQIYFKR